MRRYGIHQGCPEGVPEYLKSCIAEVVDGNKRRQCCGPRRTDELCRSHYRAQQRGSTVWIPVDQCKESP